MGSGQERFALSTGVVYGGGQTLTLGQRLRETDTLAVSVEEGCGMEVFALTTGEMQSLTMWMTKKSSPEKNILRRHEGALSLHAPRPDRELGKKAWAEALFPELTKLAGLLGIVHIVFHSVWLDEFEEIASQSWASLVVLEGDDGSVTGSSYRSLPQLSKIAHNYGLRGVLVDTAHETEQSLDPRKTIEAAIGIGGVVAAHWSAFYSEDYPHVPLTIPQGEKTRDLITGLQWSPGMIHILESPIGAYDSSSGKRQDVLKDELEFVKSQVRGPK